MAPKLLAFLHLFRIEWLYFIVGLFLFGASYLVRRFVPSLWVFITSKNPAIALLPMVVIGALLSADPTSGSAVWQVVQDALIKAVLATLTAVGLHETLKAAPGPYDGAQKQIDQAIAKRNGAATKPGP